MNDLNSIETLRKYLTRKYTGMLRVVLKKSSKQHPTEESFMASYLLSYKASKKYMRVTAEEERTNA